MNSSMAFIPSATDPHFPSHPQDFHALSDFLMRSARTSFSEMGRVEELQPDDDMSDDGSQMLGEKKRRLNLEQVKALEKSFELGNKLEPERKLQLARGLGLQPRQIAIWFQNRRARWKTKQLEKDYDVLKRQFEALKADNDALKSQNNNLQTQLMALKTRDSTGSGAKAINLNKENEGCWSNGSCRDDNGRDVNLNNTASTDSAFYPHHPQFPVNRTAAAGLAISSDGYCNMFGAIEDQNQEFWPWSEQQNFH